LKNEQYPPVIKLAKRVPQENPLENSQGDKNTALQTKWSYAISGVFPY
jgi:hypothetical protein